MNREIVVPIRFERAVFTSACTKSVRGYHLVAHSPGVNDDIAQALCQWSPTHNGLNDTELTATSLNYFPIDGEYFGISRSIIGGAEYSGRNALQTVTSILVGRLSDLELYDDNPLRLSKSRNVHGLDAIDGQLCSYPRTGRVVRECFAGFESAPTHRRTS